MGVMGLVCRFLTIRVRKLKVVLTGIVTLLVLWLLWRHLSHGVPPSAVDCKATLAHILYPNAQDRNGVFKDFTKEVLPLEESYFSIMSTMNKMCSEQMHIGPFEDGGWDVCLEGQYDIRPPCLVYSFGIGHDLRFEKGVEEKLGCEVHAFDPSMNVPSHNYSKKGHFYNIGIHNQDGYVAGGSWKVKKMGTIMKDLGHEEKTIDLLKMDVEFSEWLVLHDLLESGLIKNIRQLVMETHTPEMDIHHRPKHQCTWSSWETMAAMVNILNRLYREGFRTFYIRTNYRTQFASHLTSLTRFCCHDLHLVNTNYQPKK